jgi:hypothetical protein
MLDTPKATEPVVESKLSLTPKELAKALKESADRRKRLAAAFGLKVSGYKLSLSKLKTEIYPNSAIFFIAA